ncbi:hypothetical protein PENTCL1PPCAC_7222, partial [Pristionchus entomophagus]
FLSSSDAYKILVYNSKYAHSHSNYLGQIADILVEAGHNVTSLLPIIDSAVRDGTDHSHKIYVQPDPVVREMFVNKMDNRRQEVFEMNMANPIAPFFVSLYLCLTCVRVIDEPGLLEILKEEKFDVMIVENFDKCGIGISNRISPKSVIGVTSTFILGWHFSEWGIPQALSYRPTSLSSSLDVHSFFSRLYNLYGDVLCRLSFSFSRRSVNRALKEKFGPDYPSVA